MSANKTAQLAINTIRTLAIDAIQKANSGHPGTPLDAAPTAYTLWQQVLRYDPDHPNWLNRDRFVLSCGHASMLPVFDRTRFAPANGLAKGGYVLADAPDGKPDVILIGCGSEVSLCVQASERLTAEGIKTRVVSMPAWELFDEQDQQYQDSVLPPSVTARVAVEEASPIGWERYAGRDGVVLGMRTFGMSAPMKVVAEHFGFTPDHVAAVAKEVLARRGGGPR